jgi:phage protein D
MPLLRTETVHGIVCKFYDRDIVKVGTTAAARFTIKVSADEVWWFSTRLRAELIKRELASAKELATDEKGEAAMAAKVDATAKAAAESALRLEAHRKAEASPRKRAAAALEQAESHAELAEQKRKLAKAWHNLTVVQAKVAQVGKVAGDLAQVAPKPVQAQLQDWLRAQPSISGNRQATDC